MKALLVSFAIGAVLAVWGTYSFLTRPPADSVVGAPAGETVQQQLFGYTRYRDFLTEGKSALQGQVKFLAATVRRAEIYTRHIREKKLVFSFDALIAIHYVAEYSFGYDLKPESYEIRETPAGIEIVLPRPMMVASPAIKSRAHDVPSSSWLIDENKALVELYEGMDRIVEEKGQSMARTPEIAALCEKQLVGFFRDFLSRQPGVRHVPHIYVTHKA